MKFPEYEPPKPKHAGALHYAAVLLAFLAAVCVGFLTLRTNAIQRETGKLLADAKATVFPDRPSFDASDIRQMRAQIIDRDYEPNCSLCEATKSTKATPPADVAFRFGDHVRIGEGFYAGWTGKVMAWRDGKFSVLLAGENAKGTTLLSPILVHDFPAASLIEVPDLDDEPADPLKPGDIQVTIPGEMPTRIYYPLSHRTES